MYHFPASSHLLTQLLLISDDCTWEPVKNLHCADKILEFEEKLLADADESDEEEESERRSRKTPKPRVSLTRETFESGTKPRKFSGLVMIDDTYHIMIDFDGKDSEVVPLNDVKTKWPQMLIKYLERKMVYESEGRDKASTSHSGVKKAKTSSTNGRKTNGAQRKDDDSESD